MDQRRTSRLLQDIDRMAFLAQRHQVIRSLLGVGLIPIVGCRSNKSVDAHKTASDGNNAATDGRATTSQCAAIPEETEGPYQGDGSNGPNVLTQNGIVRSDITDSFGIYSGTAAGVPLTLKLRTVTTSGGCTAGASRAIYVWHCDRDGNYSLYSAANENYLRGVQETDADGYAMFTTIWPGCYSGRWPHIHFEIYPSLAGATSARNKTQTSQIAMPADMCKLVFATTGYSASVQNFGQTSLTPLLISMRPVLQSACDCDLSRLWLMHIR